eukprot:430074_1
MSADEIREFKAIPIKETKYSIFASHRDILNISFTIQIVIIIYGIFSFIDIAINILTIYGRICGISLFIFQLIINYNIHIWSLPHLDHELMIPHRSNCTAWIMFHFLMPIAVGRWPELIWHRLTSCCRKTYPSLIFWGTSRAGTTTIAHQLLCLPNKVFIGPLSPVTTPLAYNKEGVFFLATFGSKQIHTKYSMLFPICSNRNKIYFDGYPDYHCYPFVRDRIYAVNPNIKFIVMLRDPSDKSLSLFLQRQSTYLQITGKKALSDIELENAFIDSLNVIKSDKYDKLYNFFTCMKIDDFPQELHRNIADWTVECILGRAMFGRDLKFWFEKFDQVENWLIMDMKTVLKDVQSIKDTIITICEFMEIPLDDDFIEYWIPEMLKLNQNTIKYKPKEEYMNELKRFYENDQLVLHEFIKEKGIQFVCDDNDNL